VIQCGILDLRVACARHAETTYGCVAASAVVCVLACGRSDTAFESPPDAPSATIAPPSDVKVEAAATWVHCTLRWTLPGEAEDACAVAIRHR
jgi:hypothetical protein